MTGKFENPPMVFIKDSDPIHKNRLIFSLADGNIYIPRYFKPETEFEDDLNATINLWALTAFLDEDFFDAHIKDMLDFYIKIQLKGAFDVQ